MIKVPSNGMTKLFMDDLMRAKAAIPRAVAEAARIQASQMDAQLSGARTNARAVQPVEVTTAPNGTTTASVSVTLPPDVARLIDSVAEGLASGDNVYHVVYGAAKRLGIPAATVRAYFWPLVEAAKFSALANNRVSAALQSSNAGSLAKAGDVFGKAFSER